MKHPLISRLASVASVAVLAATGVAIGGAAHAAPYPYFSSPQGWRVDQHPRELADVNGDGWEDIVGFGDAGVWVSYAQLNGYAAPHLVVPDFGRNQGWRPDRHVRTVADVDGDGREDVVGFGDAGVHVSFAGSSGGFSAPRLLVRNFGRDQGWRVDQHPRQLVDLNGNGTADIVGFGHSGVHISHGMPDRSFSGTGKRIDSYGWDRGWRIDKNPRLLADMDGNGTADIVGFGDAGAYVSYYSGPGDTFTAAALAVPNFGHQQGWRVGQHPRELGDVNGDGRADIVGYGYSGVSVAYSQGHLSFSGVALKVRDFGQAQGWQGDRHPRTLGDIDGDGIQDLVGFGNAGVHVAHGRSGNVFGAPYLKFDDFGYDQGWRIDRHLRLLGDADGNGRDDVVAFGDHGLYLSRS
ncbi:FG-GAP repeat domain-containing protein [Kocuria sp. M1R5S2]|uniref:FG-GAP repeat domain-containing protein n=1 Tax=Kocuria rhizosphaerae TaxID=3376285 RepID=UPI0037B9EA7A